MQSSSFNTHHNNGHKQTQQQIQSRHRAEGFQLFLGLRWSSTRLVEGEKRCWCLVATSPVYQRTFGVPLNSKPCWCFNGIYMDFPLDSLKLKLLASSRSTAKGYSYHNPMVSRTIFHAIDQMRNRNDGRLAAP